MHRTHDSGRRTSRRGAGWASPATASRRGRTRRAGGLAFLALSLLFWGGSVGCATPTAGGREEVRVLIYESAAPVRVGAVSRAANLPTLSIAAGGLWVAGEPVGTSWRPTGQGPWRVGPRDVRGAIIAQARAGKIEILNRVGLEPYVASTVGGEMSASWPEEALRAQAVATRTYVLHEAAKRRTSDWDVRATEASQVYRGIAAETEQTRAAARATAGQILTYQGEPILAVFHSTAGGRTATAGEVWGQDLPYLQIVDVEEEDDAPHTYWRALFPAADLAVLLRAEGVAVGELMGLRVTQRTGSGRVRALEVRGSAQSAELEGDPLRGMLRGLRLRSTLFDIKLTDEGFAFVGSGFGHGVGMSQWGARALAERGASYQRILARFYPGARLEKMKPRRLAASIPAQALGAGELALRVTAGSDSRHEGEWR